MKKPFLGSTALNSRDVGESDMFVNESLDNDTGRYLVTLPDGEKSFAELNKIFRNKLGLKITSSADFKESVYSEDEIADAEVLIFKELGIALLGPEDDGKADRFKSLDNSAIIKNEQIVFASAIPNSPTSTWGIRETNTLMSNFTGRNVKVAVLDTGFAIGHPDFVGRSVLTASFVPGELVNDGHGHGTHCIGTSCGNIDATGVRYGVARNAKIYAGKVLNNAGSGAQAWILGGMEWAGKKKCKVVSMSLGSAGSATFDPAYEKAAKYVLSRGGIVVAAAGNASQRSLGFIAPVGSPANCPSILAVAALDGNLVGGAAVLSVANFSCGSRFTDPGCEVNIAAPGVGVYSAWPMPTRNRSISGTSMACPHVAGLLALLWEQFPAFTPAQIIVHLMADAQPLAFPNTDVGVGLALAF